MKKVSKKKQVLVIFNLKMTKITDKRKVLNNILATVFILFIIFFSYSRTKDLRKGVQIVLADEFKETVLTNKKTVDIRGTAEKARNVSISGRFIPTDEFGNFSGAVSLLPGYNKVEIQAIDRFGNVNKKDITFFMENNQELDSIDREKAKKKEEEEKVFSELKKVQKIIPKINNLNITEN